MSLFGNDLGERLLLNFNSTGKDSLQDLGGDQEEQDRIVLNASRSVEPAELRVDYSNFANHIFFNSAFTSVNLAYSRIFNDYPSDGTYKEIYEWRKLNNGYENWFFDQFPKQQGYINLTSGSGGPSIFLKDYENKLNVGVASTASVTLEFIAKPFENFGVLSPAVSILNDAQDSGFLIYFEKKGVDKWLTLRTTASGSVATSYLSVSCDGYVSSSNHFAFVCNVPDVNGALNTTCFVNGVAAASSSVSGFNYTNIVQPIVKIGHYKSGSADAYFSGCIDEFRFWNSDRSSFVSKNYFKPICANPSGGLQLYYKFSELFSYGNKIIDYSGNELHGAFSGTYSLNTNRNSGTLGAWFKDAGDPIFDSANARVVNFFTEQQNSGSIFDQRNRNYIFNIVPAFFVDGEDSDNQKLFLLLLARHYDKLKLYIEHLSNIHNISIDSKNDTPDRLMNLVAENYGIDLGDVYDSSDPLSLYFGEGVLGSGSLDSSVEVVKNQLKRNVLNNLIYFLKTKSTKESLESILYALGVDTDVININEYSLFSGGIETNRQSKVSECRVANFNTSSNVEINLSSIDTTNTFKAYPVTHQIRFLFNSGSSILTSSIISFESASVLQWGVRAERENATSTSGTLKLSFLDSGSVLRTISSSLLPLYNNEWYNLAATQHMSGFNNSTIGIGNGFYVSQLAYDQLINSQSISTGSAHILFNPLGGRLYLGSSGSNYFSGYMHEYRLWNQYTIMQNLDLFKKWHYDYLSTEINDFNNDIGFLLFNYKLNDFTSSNSNSGVVHDFVGGVTSSYTNFTTSSYYNFPGMFIPRYVQSYSYDINTGNNKLRLKNEGRKLEPSEQTKDVPFVTIDVSPSVSLNKEIVKYFGDLTKFNNIVGQPYNKYRNQIKILNQYKNTYFNNKINSKIDYKAFVNLIKWFDNNFTSLLSQFIPLDIISSISNFVIEPNVFEYGKVTYEFPYRVNRAPTTITSSISFLPDVTASSGISVLPADPGRFGAAVSASAYVPSSFNFSSSYSSSAGVNFNNLAQKTIVYSSMSNDYSNIDTKNAYFSGRNNSFYTKAISSSNYLQDVLNVNTSYYMSATNIQYAFTAGLGNTAVFYTGALNAVQDQRWLWTQKSDSYQYLTWDFGIGYGGGWGQLYKNSQKSYSANTGSGILSSSFVVPSIKNVIYHDQEDEKRKVVILWPNASAYDGVAVFNVSSSLNNLTGVFDDGTSAAQFGSIIDIKNYRSLNLEILGNYSAFKTGAPAIGAGGDNWAPPQLYFLLQFQFFDNQTTESGFESIASSSFTGSNKTFRTSYFPHEYIIYPDSFKYVNGDGSFNASFHRPLPTNNLMRLKVTPLWYDLAENGWYSYATVLIKGVLSKDNLSTVEIFKPVKLQ